MNISQTRMTRQRKIILEELRKSKSHPTAEEIHAVVKSRLPRISLGTVYRNLDFLAQTGKIRQLNFGGLTKRFDGDVSAHFHVRCLCCGKVGDVSVMPYSPPSLEELSPCASGFAITEARLEFEGYCAQCAVKRPLAAPAGSVDVADSV